MKICFLGDANSVHIQKWCKWFSEHGHDISVISLREGSIPGAAVFCVPKEEDSISVIIHVVVGTEVSDNVV